MVIAVQVYSAQNVSVTGNQITMNGQFEAGVVAALDVGLDSGEDTFGAQFVNIADNQIRSSVSFAVRVRYSKWVTVADNNIITSYASGNHPPVVAVLAAAPRVTVTGNVINHCGRLDVINLPGPLGAAIRSTDDYNVISGNSVEMGPENPEAPVTPPAIQIGFAPSEKFLSYNACTGNAIGLDSEYSVAAILLDATTQNCTAVSNVCGTVPPVDDQGSFNEVGHNT